MSVISISFFINLQKLIEIEKNGGDGTRDRQKYKRQDDQGVPLLSHLALP